MHAHAVHSELLEKTCCAARNPPHSKQLHFAAIIMRGKVIAMSRNIIGTRSRGSEYSESSCHAERAVVKQLGNMSLLRGAELFVWRVTRKNPASLSAPCPSCQVFLKVCMSKWGLRKVTYTV